MDEKIKNFNRELKSILKRSRCSRTAISERKNSLDVFNIMQDIAEVKLVSLKTYEQKEKQ